MLPILTTVCYFSNVLFSFLPSILINISHHFAVSCLGCGTVLGSSLRSERWKHLILWLHSASWLLCFWELCWHILAIHYEDEISIHSWGGQEHHHELFPHSSQHFCVCCAVQCMLHNLLLQCNAWAYQCSSIFLSLVLTNCVFSRCRLMHSLSLLCLACAQFSFWWLVSCKGDWWWFPISQVRPSC